MTSTHGLTGRTMGLIAEVLARFPEVEKAVLFGSRAKGTHKSGSDIDLSLEGEALEWRSVGRIYEALDDLLLPYRFSLIRFDRNLDLDVAAHIERVGVCLFQRGALQEGPVNA